MAAAGPVRSISPSAPAPESCLRLIADSEAARVTDRQLLDEQFFAKLCDKFHKTTPIRRIKAADHRRPSPFWRNRPGRHIIAPGKKPGNARLFIGKTNPLQREPIEIADREIGSRWLVECARNRCS
jgi:hypothetical protein